jgi:hypothetical protein
MAPIRISPDMKKKRNRKTSICTKNAKVKKRAIRLTQRQILFIAVMLLLLMGTGIGYVWSNFEGTQIGYDLSRLRKEEMRLKEINQKLRLELATLKSPQYLEEAIRGTGLRAPLPEQIIILP